jgi:hypothetical protein
MTNRMSVPPTAGGTESSGERGCPSAGTPAAPVGSDSGPGLPRSRPPWPAALLAAYPLDWRARYGDELEMLVADLRAGGRAPIPMAFDLLCGATTAWLTEERRFLMSERSRGALITVLWSWVAFAAVAAWFGHDLAIYPTASAAQQIAIVHPAVPDAYHVLYAAGVVGVAATVIAAAVFAADAARYALRCRRRSTFVLMAVPPVVAAAWLGGVQLIPSDTRSIGHLAIATTWLLLGVAGIAIATQSVVSIVKSTEFDERTWRVGGAAAAAVTAAMVVATGATITWSLVIRSTHPGNGNDSLIVTAIMAVTTARAVIALLSTRRAAAAPDAPAVA